MRTGDTGGQLEEPGSNGEVFTKFEGEALVRCATMPI
jgi:hypothetical protein